MTLTAVALPGIPEIGPGDDLAAALLRAIGRLDAPPLQDTDVITIAHKLVSKAEGAMRRLSEVTPTPRATHLAAEFGKDARQVQVVLDESAAVIRADHGVLICETRHGFICANAGVDVSNAPHDSVITLPVDPDASARRIRAALRSAAGAAPAVIITDSFGRAWRHGQLDVAIGIAGLRPLDDWRGRADAHGRSLRATWLASADAIAAAGDLLRAKDGGQPAILIRGLGHLVTSEDGPGAVALLRPAAEDLFR